MIGWIAVGRKLWKHDFFKDSPMSEREAWLWMVAQAAYADTTHRVAGVELPVPRGSFMVTLRELQSTFMWASDTRVRNFLKRLKSERMIRSDIVGRKNAPKTHVTICNYSSFQDVERTNERTGKRTKNVPSGTVKKQDNKITKEEDKSSSSQEAADYERYLKAHPKPVESNAGELAFSALVAAGEDPAQIIAAATAYAEMVGGWSSEAKVQQSDNFLAPDRGQWRQNIPTPKAAPVSKEQRMEFWAKSINEGRYVSDNSISPSFARDMIAAKLVTPEKLKERGIAA